jgi:hypothetical protein
VRTSRLGGQPAGHCDEVPRGASTGRLRYARRVIAAIADDEVATASPGPQYTIVSSWRWLIALRDDADGYFAAAPGHTSRRHPRRRLYAALRPYLSG